MPGSSAYDFDQNQSIFGGFSANNSEPSSQTIKEAIKNLLAPNMQHISYLLNFIETQDKLNESLKELFIRQGIKMLLSPLSTQNY